MILKAFIVSIIQESLKTKLLKKIINKKQMTHKNKNQISKTNEKMKKKRLDKKNNFQSY